MKKARDEMAAAEFLAESKRIEEAATPGPWEAGDWWHIQSAEFCPCRPEWGPAHVQRMSINGQMMMAHRHRRSEPLGRDVIYTEPWKDGHPRAVVITTNEYGAIDPENAEFIAYARTALPQMREALEAVLAIHSVKHGESPRYVPDDDAREGEPVEWEPYTVCTGCSASPYPCRTVRAIESALAENGGENNA